MQQPLVAALDLGQLQLLAAVLLVVVQLQLRMLLLENCFLITGSHSLTVFLTRNVFSFRKERRKLGQVDSCITKARAHTHTHTRTHTHMHT